MKIFEYSDEIWRDFVQNIFPSVCINCNITLIREEAFICSKCKTSLPRTNNYLDPTNRIFQKFAYERKIKHVSSFLDYNKQGITRKMIHALKYKGETGLGLMLGKMYGEDLRLNLSVRPDMIIPVPLHPRKFRKRGFNQSEWIARGLSESLEVPVDPSIVIRNTFTSTQTKKSKVNRWENVGKVFEVVNPERLPGSRVMLVDDVLTTGATLGSLAVQISAYGVEEIYVVAIAAGA